MLISISSLTDLYDSSVLLHRAVSTLPFLPSRHADALEAYVRALMPLQSSPQGMLHTALLAIQSSVQAVLSSLSRPSILIGQIGAAKREAERNYSSLGRSSRWPLGLLDDTRQRLNEEKEEKARKSKAQAGMLSKELRYTQQTVANELAGWQLMHEKTGRRAIRDLAKGMVVQEKMRLQGMMRALRRLQGGADERNAGTSRRGGSTMQEGQVSNAEILRVDEASGGGELA